MATKMKADATKIATEAQAIGTDAINTALKAGEEAATKAFSMGKEKFEAATKSFADVAQFNQETVELVVQTSTKTAKAVEALNAEVLAFSKAQLDSTVAAAKAAMTCKTLKELVDLQTGFFKDSVETYVKEATKFGELSQKISQEAFEPIGARFKLAVEKFAKPLAA